MDERKLGPLSSRGLWPGGQAHKMLREQRTLGSTGFPLRTPREPLTQPPGPDEGRPEVDNREEGAFGTTRESALLCTPFAQAGSGVQEGQGRGQGHS